MSPPVAPRVVFDGSVLGEAFTTGVGQAFLHVLRAYAERPDTRAILLPPAGSSRPWSMPGLEVADTVAPTGFSGRSRRLPRLLRDLSAAVFHSPVTALPWRAPCPMIATVHDVPWADDDAPREPGDRSARQRWALRHAGRQAAAIFSVSQATFRSVERALGDAPRGRHEVHHHALPSPDRQTLRPAQDRRGPIVALAGDRPRKNLQRLRRAHALARASEPALPALRIVGPPQAWIDEAGKRDLLQEASLLACVSLFEGFGLPILEGFAAGVPVLCSDRGAMREVAGDAANLVDPLDVDAMARQLVRLTKDDPLRRTSVQRGLDRLRHDFDPAMRAAAWLQTHRALAQEAERR